MISSSPCLTRMRLIYNKRNAWLGRITLYSFSVLRQACKRLTRASSRSASLRSASTPARNSSTSSRLGRSRLSSCRYSTASRLSVSAARRLQPRMPRIALPAWCAITSPSGASCSSQSISIPSRMALKRWPSSMSPRISTSPENSVPFSCFASPKRASENGRAAQQGIGGGLVRAQQFHALRVGQEVKRDIQAAQLDADHFAG